MPASEIRTGTVNTAAGVRLDLCLARLFPDLSRTRLKGLILDGCVSAGGVQVRDPAVRFAGGRAVVLAVPPPRSMIPQPQDIPLVVVHEDDHLLVIDKPAGLVVHPAPGNPDATLVNAVLAHCRGRLPVTGGVERPGIVHRIDKDTSGLLVVAKTDAAVASLATQFATHAIERVYTAVAHGVPAQPVGELRTLIGRHPRNRQTMAVVTGRGKTAITRYRLVRRLGAGVASVLECRLETGRTHQIRVHMSHLGHPLLGDPVYGRRTLPAVAVPAFPDGFGRQALHAGVLGFIHPVGGMHLRFCSQLPDDMKILIDCFE